MKLGFSVSVTVLVITITACSGDSSPEPSPPAPSATPGASASAIPTATATVSAPAPARPDEPVGFPLDPGLRTDAVIGRPGSRTLATAAGLTVREASVEAQVSVEPALANQFGWNCRVHQEYEADPAVDWYVPVGTPVYATMHGTATLYFNTVANAFDYYGVSREPYLGDPDRTRAPLAPFPGPGGGMGVYVSVTSASYRADYGHLELDPTIANVPAGAFVPGYAREHDYRTEFAAPRAADVAVASWPVARGDVIGYTGDAGYSEAPHLHYQIIRLADGAQLCPTSEPGFADGGWLER